MLNPQMRDAQSANVPMLGADRAVLSTMANSPGGIVSASSGCYDAARAAALSGVPKSTVYDWARKGLVVPTVSPVQEKFWSYADLIGLRVVAWLRRPKLLGSEQLPASPMDQVRAALLQLGRQGVDLAAAADEKMGPLVVDQRGSIFLNLPGGFEDAYGHQAWPHENFVGLTTPFILDGLNGPDLIRPRAHLRIVPDRVAGEPHIEGTRITTRTIAAMVQLGHDAGAVAAMYEIGRREVDESVDLEAVLSAA